MHSGVWQAALLAWCLPSSAAFAAGFDGASLAQSALELMRDGPYGPLPFMSLGACGSAWPKGSVSRPMGWPGSYTWWPLWLAFLAQRPSSWQQVGPEQRRFSGDLPGAVFGLLPGIAVVAATKAHGVVERCMARAWPLVSPSSWLGA